MGIPELGGVRYCTTCLAVYEADFARCPNDGGALALADRDPLIGTSVGHYQVDAYIGSGAMGRVYRCHHAHLQHKQYALKILRGDLAATMAMRMRFTQEAEAASRLVHPNVVSVADFGRTEAGLLYLVMDFVEGASLSALIARGPIAPPRAIHLAKEMCRGLTHAHDLGFVHRDFKPDNIIVVREGEHERPRIVDFGLAIHAGPDATTARLTIAGGAVGTPTYAAPEQMQHEDDVDDRADLFALGITMFEMLSGRTPFDGTMLEILHLNIAGPRPTLASRAARGATLAIPPRLEHLVQRLIAPSRDDRPASTREVLEELDAIELELDKAAVVPVSLPPPASHERAHTAASAVHARRRRGRAIVFAGAFALAAAAGAAIYLAIDDDASLQRAPQPMVAEHPIAGKPTAENVAPDKRAPDKRAPDKITPDKIAPDKVTPDKVAPDNVTPDNVAPDKVTPDNVVADKPSASKPDKRKPDKRKPDKRKPDKRTQDLRARGSSSASVVADANRNADVRVSDNALTADAPTSDSRTPDSRTPDSRTPDSRTPDSRTPDNRTPDNRTPDNRTPDKRTPDKRTPDKRTPDAVGDTRAPPAPKPVVTTASVSVEGLSVRGALTTAQVKRALDREIGALRACYGPAATKAGRSPAIAVRARFEIDETQRTRGITTSGGELPEIVQCVDRVLGNVRAEAAPDVGVVDVTVKIRFVPEGS